MRLKLPSTTRRRGLLEVGIFAFTLTFPVAAVLRPVLGLGVSHPGAPPAASDPWPVFGITMVYTGLLSGLLSAVRLPRPSGSRWRIARAELPLFVMLQLAIGAGVLSGHLVAAFWIAFHDPAATFDRPVYVVSAFAFAVAAMANSSGGYLLCRAAVLAWPAWDRLRRTRLLWALTHAQLVAGLTLAMGVAALLMLLAAAAYFTSPYEPPFGPESLPEGAGPAATFLTWLTTRVLAPVTAILGLGLAALVLILPPAAVISYVALRRTTRRLEELATATSALRAGDLAARVPVNGEDEVARLQADFNAMASELERTLNELQEERDAVARLLQARRELVAAVSHELRTPVSTVRGYLESALAHWNGIPPATLRQDLEVMASEIERLQRLIEDLFTLSRAEIGRLPLAIQPTDVAALVRRCAEAVAPLAWERGRVEVLAETQAALPPALVDPDRLEQVVRNLLANAVRHTPPGGLVLLSALAEDSALIIQVKDTGEGIPSEDLARIWDRFYRGGNARERDESGTGLGLALVKELTEAMGGSVAVESIPGEGSCFTLRLPVARAAR
ncbi:HAMP domain-containing histidine kinase [Thermomicrobiaceae bacterium CFH 74404]|uniref:histidine kinase n=1 Tax=Thermalbibacter longus TaxID=2951981 RepID=A0AA41WHV0_9BACT|nr:HAMP domain-containing sensor histidine kinase [Thermalbibacter longus]MCM8749661.1 HAMP domain-containing histidine kinase [Thermalbibacter longus]